MTTLSTIGNYIVTGLTSESQNRTDDTNVLSNPIGIASTAANYYQIVAKELDEEVIAAIQSQVDLINQKKSEIVGLCQLALGAFVPGLCLPNCSLASDTGDIDSNIDSDKGVIPANAGVGGTPTPAIAYGNVRGDYIRIQRYPRLERREAPDDNPLANMKFPILTTGNAGQGKQNVFFRNSRWNDEYVTYYVSDDEGNWSTEGWDGGDTLGRYYEITGPGPGVITIFGSVDGVNGIFTPNPEYENVLNTFTGIQTGSWDVDGPTAPISISWNPSTNQLTPTFSFLPIPGGSGVLSIASTQSCSTLASQIDALEAEITTLRSGIGTWFDGANATKQRKHSQQLRIWSYERIKIRNSEEQVGITTAIDATEVVDPQLPDYPGSTIDTEKITIDSTNVTIDLN